MDSIILIALGLMLVIEGVLPFVAPRLWRDTFRRATELNDGQLRFVGLTSMIIGMALIGEGMHFEIPKGYLYFAMAFSFGVEVVNMIIRNKSTKKA